ncbi:MAG: membrane protein insertase YidC [Micrococcales bacterium]|nr:membrane protein insertase YidC [Micrococcales bacterium]
MDSFLRPIMVVVAHIMGWTHSLFSQFLNPDSGLVWVLSIVSLVVVMRVAMVPLFVKQIRSSRGMQLLQPEMQKIQKKYKGRSDPISRQRQSEEMMALYKKHGTNPFSSCLPILLQSPFFFALFRVLNQLKKISEGIVPPIGPIDQALASSAEGSSLFGAPLSSTFMLANESPPGVSPITVRVVTVILIVLMSATVFTTQRQLTMKNMPESAKDNQMFRMQKVMLYMMPLIFAASGVNFPLGVLVYWLTTNLWSMGQQFFVIRRMPAPGSEAEQRQLERKQKKKPRKTKGGEASSAAEGEDEEKQATPGQRQQPKKSASRSQRKKSGPKPGG